MVRCTASRIAATTGLGKGMLSCIISPGCAKDDTGPTFRPPATDPAGGPPRATGTKVENPVTVTLDSGVLITEETLGQGKEAVRGSVVLVHYVGKLEDGTVFDQTNSAGPPTRFVLNTGPGGVIGGFVEGISGMHAGGIRTMVIPWAMGYGTTKKPKIPARSNLMFRVELVAVP